MDTIEKIFRIRTHRKSPSSCKHCRQGNEFGSYISAQRRAPFTKENWTCENESYRFPIDESPKDPWEQCFEVVDKADEELYKELKDEISWLLVVASLFLGIVTAFSTMSFQWIRVDDTKVSTALLGDIVKLLNDTDARGTVPPRDAITLNVHPRDSDIVVNQLWFLSMIMSLSAVVVGTLCLQWLSAFRSRELKQKRYIDALALRQLRFEGLMGWGIPLVPGFLLLAVQISLVLFGLGLMQLLWSVNTRVAIPVVLVGSTTALLLTITAVMPLLQSVIGWIFPSTLIIPQCPYKSPLAWIFHRFCLLLPIIVSLPFYLHSRPKSSEKRKVHTPCSHSWLERLSGWCLDQIDILIDYTWQAFDDLWRRQRECRGPQQSKSKSKYSYYLVQGLASAMGKLVFQPHAVHIIHTCLQDFHGTSAEEETFEDLFGKSTPVVKQALSEYSAIVKEVVEDRSRPRMSSFHKESLRRDFLNAFALQSFVTQNSKLHRALLPHRVELYIRIKTSSQHFDALNREGQYIGTSIECPIRDTRDAQALSAEIRYQFLKFADWFLDTDRGSSSDIKGVKHILDAVNTMKTARYADIDEPSLGDRLERVLKVIDKNLTDKSHQCGQPSSAAATESGGGGGGRNGPPPVCEYADQECRSVESTDDVGDNPTSPVSLSPSVLMDLYPRVLGKLHRAECRRRRGTEG